MHENEKDKLEVWHEYITAAKEMKKYSRAACNFTFINSQIIDLENSLNDDEGDVEQTQEAQDQTDSKQFIRIFRDGVDKELWDSYCLGLGIKDPDKVQSFKILIDSAKNIKIDEYDASGNIIGEK